MNQRNANETKNKEETVSLTEENKADLSLFEDLTVGLMNLISLEEHFFFSYAKTSDATYLTYLNEIRNIRKKILPLIVKNPKGEEWCASKHLLASSMRFYEVGTKLLSQEKKEDAQSFFKQSFDLLSLFFLINQPTAMGNSLPENDLARTVHSENFLEKISSIVKKAMDCCRE
jgi:hypothetical protein